MEQKLIFYFDDSGVLHNNSPEDYFIYAGYMFKNIDTRNEAKRKYIYVNKAVKKELNCQGEIKACDIGNKHRRSLYNVLKYYESLSVIVKIDNLYDHILSNKKSICRYKDYVLKRVIKEKTRTLIKNGEIDPMKDTQIFVNIDEQLTATNGYYDLKGSIHEELRHGIINYDYSQIHQPLFKSKLDVVVKYCESKHDYMIQASDILANRILGSFKYDKPELRDIPNHSNLTLP